MDPLLSGRHHHLVHHCFDRVRFCINHSSINNPQNKSYERVLEEDEQTNRMKEALVLFEQVITNKWFTDTPTVLFLNKKDLFEKRIKVSPITKCFKEYEGANEYQPAVDYIKEQFQFINKSPKRSIFSHETCATDTKNVEVVWSAVRSILLEENFDVMGY